MLEEQISKIRVMMDYCSTPLWNLETGENLELNQFPLSEKTRTLLTQFQSNWEKCHSSLNNVSFENYKKLNKMALACCKLVKNDLKHLDVYMFWENSGGLNTKYIERKEQLFERFNVRVYKTKEEEDEGKLILVECENKKDEEIYKDKNRKGETFNVIVLTHEVSINDIIWGETIELQNNGDKEPTRVIKRSPL